MNDMEIKKVTGIGAQVGLKTRIHPKSIAAQAEEVALWPTESRAVNAIMKTD
jgi:hypothetical protein